MELFYFQQAEQLNSCLQKELFLKSSQNGAEFLQSSAWGKILQKAGEDVLRVGIRQSEKDVYPKKENLGQEVKNNSEEKKVLLVATGIKKKLFASLSYLYFPRGPLFSTQSPTEKKEVLNFFVQEIKKKYPHVLFLRLELQDQNKLESKLVKIKKTLDIQPAQTLILDLSLDEKQLLMNMHQKTRYNLRLAIKKGVSIHQGSLADLAEFWRLLSLTGKRDNFRLHNLEHYKNLLTGDEKFIRLYFASYQGHNIASGLFSFYQGRATYMHGASDHQFRNLMAPYLLQWFVIQEAKKEEYQYYDFYGLDEKKWPGVSRFKLGFGGQVIKYPGTYDFIFQPVIYRLYNFFRLLKRAI